MRVAPICEEEWCESSASLYAVVVCKFSWNEELIPVVMKG